MRKLLAILLLLLSFGGIVYATEYYVNCTSGNDSTGTGAVNAPWKSDGKAHDALDNLSGAHNVHVSGGPCLNEGPGTPGTGGANSGSTITHLCDDNAVCEMRIDSTNSLGYVYRNTSKTGTNIWQAGANAFPFQFRMDLLGDNSANTTKYWFDDSAAANYQIYGGEVIGITGQNFFKSASDSLSLTIKRMYIHGFGVNRPIINARAGTIVFNGNYLDTSLLDLGQNVHAITDVTLLNNTFYNSPVGDTSGTVTISGSFTYFNNLHLSTATVYGSQFDTITGTVSTGNNAFYNSAPASPRTNATYPKLALTGSGTTAWSDNSYYINPGFNTAPVLLSTSLALCRGNSTTYEATGYNGVAFDSNCPTIGAWYPTGGTKQYLTPTAKKVGFVGDSFTYGSGCTLGTNCYFNRIWSDADFSGWTFSKMPSDATRPWGISGVTAATTLYMAQDMAATDTPKKIALLIGVNDLNSSIANSVVQGRIENTLKNLIDLGWSANDVIFIGTEPQSCTVPTYANSQTVENAVTTTGDTNGWRSTRLVHKALKDAGWAARVCSDGLHWNDTGHALIAEIVKPALLADAMISNDSKTYQLHAHTPSTNGKYGLYIAGDSATVKNVSIRGYALDGIIIKAASATLQNVISSANTGYEANLTLSNASLSLTENHNNFYGSVNGFTANGAGTINADPLFQSSTDLHLQTTSPAIYTGTDVSLTSDADGLPIRGATPNMGAYETWQKIW